jgi:hypothetical protein
MAARYHPLYDGIWNDDKLEGAPFEEIGFFIYLFANSRQRPSGIYRVTDQQIASDTRLSLAKVRQYVADLDKRHTIVRDSVWIFVRGYFGRQPKQDALLRAVQKDIDECSSIPILQAFAQKYPHYRQWSADRLKTFTGPSADLGTNRADQSSTEQSRSEQSSGPSSEGRAPSDVTLVTGSNKGQSNSPTTAALKREDAPAEWFFTCPEGKQRRCVRTEYLGRVDLAVQCDAHEKWRRAAEKKP